MSSAKAIRTQIRSVEQTKKITKAMELVAASKKGKAVARMATSGPYAEKMRQVIYHVAHSHPEYHHPYLDTRPLHRVGLVVVSSDRGLCGGLNNNLFKLVVQQMRQWQEEGIDVELCLVGNKALSFFRRLGGNIVAQANHLGDAPSVMDLIGVVKVMLSKYDEGLLDGLHVANNHFLTTMSQKPNIQQLLPIDDNVLGAQWKGSATNQMITPFKKSEHWDYIYEPESKELLDILFTRYIESQVYQSVVENIACEQAARMVAMKSATDNASELINELRLVYNKARQASITKELAEIVGGAAAVE